MAQATRRATPAKPAAKAAPKPQPQPARTATTAAPTKAQQAAAAQGRPAPAARPTPAPASPRPAQRQAVATTHPADANLPAHMRDDANLGKESIGREDIETPRIKLMQGLSKELEAYDGLRPGYFFHSAAEFIFEGPFIGVPIFMDRRYLLWRPLENGGGILARADDGMHWNPPNATFNVTLDKKDGGASVQWQTAKTVPESGLAAWGTMNPADPSSPPAATLMYTYVLAFPEYPDLIPAALTFQRSSIKNGRKLNTKLKTVRTPLFGTAWTFSPVKDKNSSGKEFFNVEATGAGLVGVDVGTPELYQQYRQMFEQFSNVGLQIKDIEGLQGEEDTAGTGNNADNPSY